MNHQTHTSLARLFDMASATLSRIDPSTGRYAVTGRCRQPSRMEGERLFQMETEGWGAKMLSYQDEDGQWAGGAFVPADFDPREWQELGHHGLPRLFLVAAPGVRSDPSSDRAKRTVELIGANSRWDEGGQPYWEGEVEECINGRTVADGAYFGVDVCPLSTGWSASVSTTAAGTVRGSTARSARHSHRRSTCWKGSWSTRGHRGTPESREARKSGEEYLLKRNLFRRLSTGEPADERFLHFLHPNRWRYDVLRALDYFRSSAMLTGADPDPRLGEAIDHVRSRRLEDGTWPLDWSPTGRVWFDVDDAGHGFGDSPPAGAHGGGADRYSPAICWRNRARVSRTDFTTGRLALWTNARPVATWASVHCRSSQPMEPSRDISRLLEIMAAPRTPVTGCPWDLEQNFETIAPYTLEEAYEVADAISRGDLVDLRDELGDLLLQVVFHAHGEEQGAFDFGGVVEAITTKMIRRHPHVFGDERRAAPAWPKACGRRSSPTKRQQGATLGAPRPRSRGPRQGLSDGVPVAMPALTRALKLQEKAARVGFDWKDAKRSSTDRGRDRRIAGGDRQRRSRGGRGRIRRRVVCAGQFRAAFEARPGEGAARHQRKIPDTAACRRACP